MTIRHDVQILMCSYPIEAIRGRYGGGIKVLDGFYLYRKLLTPEQAELLTRLSTLLDGHDLDILNSIIRLFAL